MKYRGFVTLLMAMVMMTLALMLVMRPYHQIKMRVPDMASEISKVQAFWEAEGVFECLWVRLVSSYGLIDDDDSHLCGGQGITVNISGQRERSILVQNDYLTLEKSYRLPLPTTPGVMKISARLILTKPARFTPDPGKQADTHDWQCTVLRYQDSFKAPSVTTYHPEQLTAKPYHDFPELTGQFCQSGYHSVAQDSAHTEHDFYHDPTLSPFLDMFGVSCKQWRMVADGSGYPSVSRFSVRDNLSCAALVSRQIQTGQRIVWINGDCYLSDPDVFYINQTIQTQYHDDGVILVVRDGTLAIKSDRFFRGAIVQFITPAHQNLRFTSWSQSPLFDELFPVISQYHIPPERLGYFQSGRFFPLGGLFIDLPGFFAVIDGDLDTQFQRDIILGALNTIRPVRWLPGSWYEY